MLAERAAPFLEETKGCGTHLRNARPGTRRLMRHAPPVGRNEPAGTGLPERTAGPPDENRRVAPRYSRGSPLRVARANSGAIRYRAEKTDFTSV